MNKETREFFGKEVSFNEKVLRQVLASQLGNTRYIEGKKKVLSVIFNRSVSYDQRKKALFILYKHLESQGIVEDGNGYLTNSQMLNVMREVLN